MCRNAWDMRHFGGEAPRFLAGWSCLGVQRRGGGGGGVDPGEDGGVAECRLLRTSGTRAEIFR